MITWKFIAGCAGKSSIFLPEWLPDGAGLSVYATVPFELRIPTSLLHHRGKGFQRKIVAAVVKMVTELNAEGE